jgi:TPR repeat protein
MSAGLLSRSLFTCAVVFAAPVCLAQYGVISPQELTQKAEAGDVEAQFRLGSAYDSGAGVPRDGTQARKWYRRAAEAGHAEAQNSMASVLQAERRYEEARSWYERAAAQGHPLATNSLGYLYDLGLGVSQDRRKGFELYSSAADLGWAEAMWNLANIYGAGQLGEKDLDMACVWTLRALKYVEPGWRQSLVPASRAAGFFERDFPEHRFSACKQRAEDWRPSNAKPKRDAQQPAGG